MVSILILHFWQGWNTKLAHAAKHTLTGGEYKLTSHGEEWLTPHIQTFPVNSTFNTSIDRVRFEVFSNHGHQQYTCIYHVRLEGQRDDVVAASA
jgi:hypothetical protein